MSPQSPEQTALLRALLRTAVVLASVPFLWSSGCTGDSGTATQPAAPEPIVRATQGAMGEVRLRLSAAELSIADRLELTLEARHGEDVEVRLPEFGEKLEQFGIADYRTRQPRLGDDGRVIVSRTYELEPFLSGTYTIPAMTVTFVVGEGDGSREEVVTTEPVSITVTSLLPEDYDELDIEDIEPPVFLPAGVPIWVWVAATLGMMAGIIGALVVWFERRTRRQAETLPLPAHEVAYEALRRLVADDLIGRGEVKEFYRRLSGIIRRYIELRFGLHAPEQTTEEFLEDLRGGEALAAAHRSLLERFLTHCDLVKFAEHQPAQDDIQNTFDACKAFIEETASDALPADRAAGPAGEGD